MATSTIAFAEETAGADLPSLQSFDAADFQDQAANLPSGLVEALDRDLGIDGATYLANAAAGNIASQVVSALKEAGVDINGAVYEAGSQDLTVYVSAEVDVPLVEGVGAKVEVGEAPEGNAPDEADAFADWKGGFGYMNPETGRCSAGFNGFDAAGDPLVLTAGHCNPDNADIQWVEFAVDSPRSPGNQTDPWPEGPEIGQGGTFLFGENHDAGLFPVTNTADWEFPAVVSQWGGGQGSPDDGEIAVTDHVDPLVGQEVCRSGASTGFQCGEVLFVDETLNIGDDISSEPVTGFITTACATQGDSGGSYLSGTAAVGTLTGGTGPTDPGTGLPDPDDACNGWTPYDPETGEGHFTFPYAVSGSATSSIEYFGDDFELKVQISTPTVTAPADGDVTSTTPTFEGTVDNGSTNYTARVRIDDGEQYRATVAADGSFSIPVDDELELGTHTYELAVGYGQFSRSESVTGTFDVEEATAETLTVDTPEDGQATNNARPSFSGTGQPGATVTLTVGDEEYGSATVGDDGTWTIEPEADLPVAERFDAVVTQAFEGDEQSVTVADLGIRVAEATISTPEDGSEAPADVVFEGTAQPGSDLSITLVPADAEDAAPTTLTALSGSAVGAMDEDDAAPQDTWAGEWTFEGNAWTFTPAEPIEVGDYTVTLNTQLGADEDLGASDASSTFSVVSGGGDAGGGDDDLPDTGSNSTPLIIGAIALMLAGGAAVAVRARRTSTNTTA